MRSGGGRVENVEVGDQGEIHLTIIKLCVSFERGNRTDKIGFCSVAVPLLVSEI